MSDDNTLNFFVPSTHNDPTHKPDKHDFAEALVTLLNEKVIDGIGCVIAGQTDNGEIIVETWPVSDTDDKQGQDYRIIVTRLRPRKKPNA